MVAVFTGLGAGFERSSVAQIGSGGLLGSGAQGRGGDTVSVNAATGNLLISRQDEFLIGRGLDVGIGRTYNSLGALDANGDHWRQSTERGVRLPTGTLNTNGATITRVSADGSEIKYTFSDGAYRTTDGSGSHDTITYASEKWTWTDGDTGIQEIYYGTGNRIHEQIDRDGNRTLYEYHSDGRLKNLKTADGSEVHYSYDGSSRNVTSILTKVGNDSIGFESHTRTYYEYDDSDRLIKVVTDLTPEDNSAETTGSGAALAGVQGESYVTTYSYHASTNFVASITQTDGSRVDFSYDSEGRITRLQQYVEGNDVRNTIIGYASNVTSVTDPSGSVTRLFHDDKGQLVQVVSPPANVGGESQVIQYEYDNDGNLIRTINSESVLATNPNNLVDTQDWGGGEAALQGENLIDDSGWPTDIDAAPSGSVAIEGWSSAYNAETEWTSTAGPYGEQVVSLHAGQTNTSAAGGGAYSHSFDFDASKDYAFTYYLKADELNKHRAFFGLGGGVVKLGNTGADSNNPYFTTAIPSEANGIEAGKWYKVVGYVLAEGSELSSHGSYGGVYDTETGEKVRDVNHFIWREDRTRETTVTRFFNFYDTDNQGKFTHFYKPEVREISNAALLGANSRLDVERDAALLNAPIVDGWSNAGWAYNDGEARWSEVDGPNGGRIVALQAGQFDAAIDGGGQFTNYFDIDGSQTYKFTQYVRKSDLTKHFIYYGLSGGGVKAAHTGNVNGNPYFYAAGTDAQQNALEEDKWYKIVSYVLPEGTENVAYGSLGGVYDAETGEKVANTTTYRWDEGRSNDSVRAHFFTYHDQTDHGWSTYFGAPEVTEISNADLANDNANPFGIIYDESGQISRYTYDTHGNILTATDPLGRVTRNTYNADNTLRSVAAERSSEDAANELGVDRFVYDGEGHLRYSISSEGRVTEYRYNVAGNLTNEIQYTQHAYAEGDTVPTLGQLNAWRNGLDRTESQRTLHYYDERGNRYRTVEYGDTNAAGVPNTTEGFTDLRFTYDSAGRLLTSKTTADLGSSYAYDGLGRTIQTTSLNGGTTSIVFNDAATQTVVTSAGGLVTTSTYNKVGNLVSETSSGYYEPTGTSTYEYDKNGRLRIETDATNRKTYYIYDEVGNLTATVDSAGQVQEFRYDDDGQQIASARFLYYKRHESAAARDSIIAALSDPNNSLTVDDVKHSINGVAAHHSYDVWQFTAYDDRGQVSRTVLGDGSVTAYTYDSAGRLVGTRNYVNKLSSAQLAELRAGTAEADSYLPATHSNDVINRTFYDRDGLVVGTLDGEGYLTQNTYDAAGRLRQTSIFKNQTTTSLRSGGTFNQLLNSISTSASGDSHTRYVYDGQGLLRFTIDPSGQVTETVYGTSNKAIGLVRSTIEHFAPLSGLGDYEYTTVKDAVAALGSKGESRTSWAVYNTRNQLVYTVDAQGGVTQLSYDDRGNVIKTTQFAIERLTTSLPTETVLNTWADWADSNDADVRITRNYYSAENDLRFSVDAEGYVTKYDYDAENRLTYELRFEDSVSPTDAWTIATVNNASKGSFVRTQYTYDHRGRISSVYDPNGTRHYTGYFANGEVSWEIRAFGHGADESRVIHNNDAAGRRTRTRTYQGSYTDSSDPNYRDYRQTVYTYDGLGNITRQLEDNGTHTDGGVDYYTDFEYDKAGNLTKQTNAEGGVTLFEYNAFGQVTKITDPNGGVTTNTYNQLGQLVSTKDAENGIETYTYDVYGQVKTFTNKTGGVTHYVYDKLGRQIEERVVATIYNNVDAGLATEIVNKIEYDAFGAQTKTIEAFGRAEARTTEYIYDKRGLLVEQSGEQVAVYTSATSTSSTDVVPTETYKYDSRGNLIESQDALGARTVYYYDNLDRVTHQVSPEGTLVRNVYDLRSNLIETYVYEDPVDNPQTDTPPSGGDNYRKTSFVYDKMDRVTDSYVHDVQTAELNSTLTITRGDHVLHTQYVYDASSNVVKVIDPNGGETFSYYDKLNRKTLQVDSEGYATEWTYDANGNVKEERRFAQKLSGPITTSSSGSIPHNWPSATVSTALNQTYQDRVTRYKYDDLGQRIEEKRENVLVFDSATNDYSVRDSVIKYTYSALGQVTKKTEATGDYITYTYDAQGRLSKETRSGYTDHLNNNVSPEVRYLYNGLGDLDRTLNLGKTGSVNHAYTHFDYDRSGRLISRTDAEGFERHYAYDAKGQLVRETYVRDGNDEGIGYEYDLEGRVISQGAIKKVGNNWVRTDLTEVETQYNAFGDVSARGVNGVFAETFDYDNAGRVWRSTAGDGTFKYFLYDNNGNQTVSITSDGRDIDNKTIADVLEIWGVSAEDANNNNIVDYADRVRTHYVDHVNATLTKYDARNLAVEVFEPEREIHNSSGALIRQDLVTSRAYNAFGNVTSESDANGNTIDYTYNTMGRRIKVESPEVEVVGENGQVVTDTTGDTNKIRPTEYYYYDVSGRLVASEDANGNLTRQTLLAGTGYDGSAALIQQTIAADGGRVTTGYDIHGNAREITSQLGHTGGGVANEALGYTTYQSFDRLGRVQHISHASGLIDSFSYDGLGQQIEKWNNVQEAGGPVSSAYFDPFDDQLADLVAERLAELTDAQEALDFALDDAQEAQGALEDAVEALEAARNLVDVTADALDAARDAVAAAIADLNAANAALTAAQDRVAAAQAALDSATSGPEIAAAQAELDEAEAALAIAEQDVLDAEAALVTAQEEEAAAAAAAADAQTALEQAEQAVAAARAAFVAAIAQANTALDAARAARTNVIAERDGVAAEVTRLTDQIATKRFHIGIFEDDLREQPDPVLEALINQLEAEIRVLEQDLAAAQALLNGLNAALPAALAQHDQAIAEAEADIADLEYDLAILDNRASSASSSGQAKTSGSYKTSAGKTQAASAVDSESSAKTQVQNTTTSYNAAKSNTTTKSGDVTSRKGAETAAENLVTQKQTALNNLAAESQQAAQKAYDDEVDNRTDAEGDVATAQTAKANADTAETAAANSNTNAQNSETTAEQALTNAQNALAPLQALVDSAREVRDEASLRHDEIQAVVDAENAARDAAEEEAARLNLTATDIYADKAITSYDADGRVILQRNIGGDVTTNSYSWNGSLATSGLGTFGGWQQVTTVANLRTQTTQADVFGRELTSNDLGGNVATTTYNKAGQAVSRTGNGVDDQSFSYLNTGRLDTLVVTDGNYTSSYLSINDVSRTTSYKYDAVGNLLNEKLTETTTITYSGGNGYYGGYEYLAGTTHTTTQVLQNSTATYDALGRLQSWTEAGGTTLPTASKFFDYDAQGNIRHTVSNFHSLDANGNTGAADEQESWFLFDNVNRIITANGELNNGVIERGTTGVDIAYDKAGQRAYTLQDSRTGFSSTITTTRENYTYNVGGQVTEVRIKSSTAGDPGTGGTRRSSMSYDLLGRQTRQIDYQANGVTVAFDNTKTYNNASQITDDTSITRRGNDTFRTVTRYTYGSGASYALGAARTITTTYYEENSSTKVETAGRTTNSFDYYAGAVTSATTFDSDITTSKNRITNTSYSFSDGGLLLSARINDGRSRTVTFTNDTNGQIIRRDEADNKTGGDPHEIWYRFGGKEMGYVGNNGTLNTNYSQSIADRTTEPVSGEDAGAFRHGRTSSTSHTDFDQAYQAINSYNQGSTYGTYSVRGGDTLQSIASNVYGDSSLWYKIAQTNGLTSGSTLIAGQSLNLPSGVVKSTHNASTYQPYSPGEAQGDLNPTTPLPPKDDKGCGVIGQILVTVVTIAATVATGGNAVIGNLAGQVFGLATGIQDKFSFKSLATAFVTQGVGSAVKEVAGAATSIGGAVVRGAATSAISQGIGVATGLQSSFSWAGVAAAGVSAGVGFGVGQALDGRATFGSANGKAFVQTSASVGNQIISGTASSIASAATRSAINGTNFGDSLVASIPDVVGNIFSAGFGSAIGGPGKVGIFDANSGFGQALNSFNSATDFAGTLTGQIIDEAYQGIKRSLANPVTVSQNSLSLLERAKQVNRINEPDFIARNSDDPFGLKGPRVKDEATPQDIQTLKENLEKFLPVVDTAISVVDKAISDRTSLSSADLVALKQFHKDQKFIPSKDELYDIRDTLSSAKSISKDFIEGKIENLDIFVTTGRTFKAPSGISVIGLVNHTDEGRVELEIATVALDGVGKSGPLFNSNVVNDHDKQIIQGSFVFHEIAFHVTDLLPAEGIGNRLTDTFTGVNVKFTHNFDNFLRHVHQEHHAQSQFLKK